MLISCYFLTNIQFHANPTPQYYGVRYRITHHNNKTLFWHVATTRAVFSLVTGLYYKNYLLVLDDGPTDAINGSIGAAEIKVWY